MGTDIDQNLTHHGYDVFFDGSGDFESVILANIKARAHFIVLHNPDMRHAAILRRGARLYVFWTARRAAPELVWVSTIEMTGDWMSWQESAPVVVRPERPWEGADLPVTPPRGGSIDEPANQLRDPAIFEEDGRVYLLYSVAGERGIGLAEVRLTP